jgi:hypothetical protein
MVIKRIGPVSLAKVCGTLYAIVGVFIGGIFSLVALAGSAMSDTSSGAGFGALLGAGAFLIFPILYGGLGFVTTLLGAWLYNLVAGWVGGVEMELQ